MAQSAQQAHAARDVTGVLTYLVDTGETPVTYPSVGGEGETRYAALYEEREVTIHDARPMAGQLSLDCEGFALIRHETAVTDFYDDTQIEACYNAEVERLVKEATGATRVVIFDHTRRADAQATREQHDIREPARNVHNDYTDRSGPQRVRDLLPEEAEELLKRRLAIVNVWRPIKEPVETSPLALCDAQSVAPEDLIASERRSKSRVGEIHQVVFNPRHRWFYLPAMTRDEALLIKTYDSETDGRARFTIHSAFDDPTTPPDAAPRESIETRTFAFF